MMLLKPPDDVKERIVVTGLYGSGKTFGYWTILNHTDARLFILDTDRTVPSFLRSERFKEHADRVTWNAPREWPEYVETLAKWNREMGENDWLVVDNGTRPWSEVQNYFVREVFGVEPSAHLLSHRKSVEEAKGKDQGAWANPFDGMMDWPTINKLYDAFVNEYLYAPGHVYITANSKEVHYREKDRPDMSMYQAFGVKPDGQKHLGHMCNTVLLLMKRGMNDYRINTIKDREREELVSVKLGEFAVTYLLGVAGWTP